MLVKIDLKKSLEENASQYFESAKKARKKILGVKKTLEEFKTRQKSEVDDDSSFESTIIKLEDKKKFWFEKFRWFVSSEGFLVIGARDATTNEIIIKKHLSEGDIVFHTDMAGSPFVVVKSNSQEDIDRLFGKNLVKQASNIGSKTISEAASFTFAHSKAWKQGLSSAAVFWVKPSQVTKDARAGESLTKGSFVIKGKTNYVDFKNSYSVGLFDSKKFNKSENPESLKESENSENTNPENQKVFKEDSIKVFLAGPLDAIKKYGSNYFIIEQGREKPGMIAKKIRSLFKETDGVLLDLDQIIRNLPQGIQLKKERRRK